MPAKVGAGSGRRGTTITTIIIITITRRLVQYLPLTSAASFWPRPPHPLPHPNVIFILVIIIIFVIIINIISDIILITIPIPDTIYIFTINVLIYTATIRLPSWIFKLS